VFVEQGQFLCQVDGGHAHRLTWALLWLNSTIKQMLLRLILSWWQKEWAPRPQFY
jgi:hypothetical protein